MQATYTLTEWSNVLAYSSKCLSLVQIPLRLILLWESLSVQFLKVCGFLQELWFSSRLEHWLKKCWLDCEHHSSYPFFKHLTAIKVFVQGYFQCLKSIINCKLEYQCRYYKSSTISFLFGSFNILWYGNRSQLLQLPRLESNSELVIVWESLWVGFSKVGDVLWHSSFLHLPELTAF